MFLANKEEMFISVIVGSNEGFVPVVWPREDVLLIKKKGMTCYEVREVAIV